MTNIHGFCFRYDDITSGTGRRLRRGDRGRGRRARGAFNGHGRVPDGDDAR